MHSTIRLAVFAAASAMLLFFSQPVLSQEQTPELQRGIADYRQENYEEALESLLKARKIEPSSSVAAYFLGITYKNLQNYKEAQRHLKDAVTLSPKIKEAVLELAEVHLQLGELEAALKVLAIAERGNIRGGQTAFLKGLVLLKKNDNFAAVDSFMKAKWLNPALTQAAEYQIGLAYMKVGELSEAEKRFEAIIVKDPNTDMAAFAGQYIDAIARKREGERALRVSLGLSYQYDDNVMLKPGDSAVAAGITGESDSREVVTAKIEYVPRLDGPWGVRAQYSLYLSNHHNLATHDVMSHTAALVPSYSFKTGMASLLLSHNRTWVDYDEYLATTTISPAYTHALGAKQMLQASLRYQMKDYQGVLINIDENRDAHEYGVSLGWLYLFARDKGLFSLRYELNREDADGQNWDYTGNKGSATLLVPFKKKFKLSLSGETYYQDFKNIHSAFGKKREDTTYTVSTLLSYKFRRKANLTFLYAHISGDSNMVIYDYDKNIYSMGVEWKY